MMAVMIQYDPVGAAPLPQPGAGFTPASEEDDVARRLLRPLFPADRELLLLAGFDAFERLAAFESIDAGTAARCTIAPRRWRGLPAGRSRFLLMAPHPPPAAAPPPGRPPGR